MRPAAGALSAAVCGVTWLSAVCGGSLKSVFGKIDFAHPHSARWWRARAAQQPASSRLASPAAYLRCCACAAPCSAPATARPSLPHNPRPHLLPRRSPPAHDHRPPPATVRAADLGFSAPQTGDLVGARPTLCSTCSPRFVSTRAVTDPRAVNGLARRVAGARPHRAGPARRASPRMPLQKTSGYSHARELLAHVRTRATTDLNAALLLDYVPQMTRLR